MGDATIIRRDFAYAPDQALAIRAAEFRRKLNYPNWARIRLGFLFALERNAESIRSTRANERLWFGLSNDLPVSSFSTANFVGVSYINSPTATALSTTYNYETLTASDFRYPYTNQEGYPFTKYGNTYVVSATKMTSGHLFYMPLDEGNGTANMPRRGLAVIDITRPPGGSGNATISAYHINTSSAVNMDFRPDHLMQALAGWGTPTVNSVAMQQSLNAVALTIGEEFGVLDHVCLYWNVREYAFQLHAIGAVVLHDGGYTTPGGGFYSFEGYSAGTYVPGTTVPSYGTLFNTSATGTYIIPKCLGDPVYQASGTNVPNDYPLAIFNGTAQFAGTALGWPIETFESYGTGTVLTGVTGSGTTWSSPIVLYGNGPEFPQRGISGTSVGTPWDTFESYTVGTVASGVTVSAGTGWVGPAYVYDPP